MGAMNSELQDSCRSLGLKCVQKVRFSESGYTPGHPATVELEVKKPGSVLRLPSLLRCLQPQVYFITLAVEKTESQNHACSKLKGTRQR